MCLGFFVVVAAVVMTLEGSASAICLHSYALVGCSLVRLFAFCLSFKLVFFVTIWI